MAKRIAKDKEITQLLEDNAQLQADLLHQEEMVGIAALIQEHGGLDGDLWRVLVAERDWIRGRLLLAEELARCVNKERAAEAVPLMAYFVQDVRTVKEATDAVLKMFEASGSQPIADGRRRKRPSKRGKTTLAQQLITGLEEFNEKLRAGERIETTTIECCACNPEREHRTHIAVSASDCSRCRGLGWIVTHGVLQPRSSHVENKQ